MENNAQKPGFPRQAYRIPVLFLLIPLLAALLSSCITLNDPEVSQEYRANAIGTITSDQTVGQTFVSRRRNFENITIWYSIDPQNTQNDGVLTATLYHTISID
jgi:hypothetical protein